MNRNNFPLTHHSHSIQPNVIAQGEMPISRLVDDKVTKDRHNPRHHNETKGDESSAMIDTVQGPIHRYYGDIHGGPAYPI